MMSVTRNIGVACFILCFLSCAKDFRTANQLKKDPGKWEITYCLWHGIANFGLIQVDTTGSSVLSGYFEFGKHKQGAWYCNTDSVFGSDLGVGSSFEWHVEKEEIDLYSYMTEPQDLSEHPLFYETWSSFKGRLADSDKDFLTLDGYFKRAWTDGTYIILFAQFYLQKND